MLFEHNLRASPGVSFVSVTSTGCHHLHLGGLRVDLQLVLLSCKVCCLAGAGDTSGRVVLNFLPFSASLGDTFFCGCVLCSTVLSEKYVVPVSNFLAPTTAVRTHFSITFKVLLLVYKALHGLAPSYISDLLDFKTYSRSLRSSCKEYLVVPRSRLKTYGDRAFSIAGPKLWNDLPLEIRKCASVATFKQSLKTFLFKLAYRL